MARLPDLETPFRKRAHRLPSPVAENFDAHAWHEAFASCDPTEDDRRLYEGALWIGEQAQSLYADRPSSLARLGPSDAVALALAVLNTEYRKLTRDAQEARIAAATEGALALDYVANIRFENAHGQNMSSGDYVEAFVDALEAWLFDAGRCLPASGPVPTDLDAMVEPLVRFYSMRHILKRLYDKALHLGHYLDEAGVWVPHDRELASLHQAWFGRAEAVFSAAPAQLLSAWVDMQPSERRKWGLERSVIDARMGRNGLKLKVGRLGYLGRRAPQQPLARIGLRQSYLSDLLDEPLPLEPVLTAAMLEDAWWVCADAARTMASAAMRQSEDKRTVGQLANAIEADELIGAVAKALKIDSNVAAKLVTFLTYPRVGGRSPAAASADSDRGWRGLWTAPLVPLPGTTFLLLPPAVFNHCAPLYRLEAWLEKGGLGDQGLLRAMRGNAQRGNRFESSYRAELRAAAAENDFLRSSCVAPDQIKKQAKEGGFSEQIDVLFKLGNRLFVGELKFLLTPADPHQWRRHYAKLREAAGQARRKAAALEVRPDVAAAALGLSEEEVACLPVTPLVLLNNGFGFSLEVDGCRVLDAIYLRDFLRSPEFSTGGAVFRGKLISEEVTIVYSNESDAALRFDRIMARPGVLVRFLDRIKWDVIDYPAPGAAPLRVASPFRGDMTAGERERRKFLVPEMNR